MLLLQDFADYCRFRPTQYNETDVYVCESMYDEAKRQIRPLPNGLKKYKLSGQVNPGIYIMQNTMGGGWQWPLGKMFFFLIFRGGGIKRGNKN